MQFIKNGPDIPESLLRMHEDGKVVFFCGAGISMPAGLPNFAGLVDQLFNDSGRTPSGVQKEAIQAQQYDKAIELLEADILGGRKTIRKKLHKILSPNLNKPNLTTTHRALLTLAKNRNNKVRLVTTNFDRLFEETIRKENLPIEHFQAPLLPIPKNHWDGLVYLHGLLPSDSTDNMEHLVLSSGDYGLAYLLERWAARFVGGLFHNYTVCFVGYGVNDHVIRYMMDALAADRLRGEASAKTFAFDSCPAGKEEEHTERWKAKNVIPIFYPGPAQHDLLHKTLQFWAATYRDGVYGKERIVERVAIARPSASTSQDDFVGRFLWAVSDSSGLPAKRFSEFNPVPSLEWLEPLSNERYQHDDLPSFGVSPLKNVDPDLKFSLLHRPAPYDHAPWMSIIRLGFQGSRWDNVMTHMANWLTRHLNNPNLLFWLVQNGEPHDQMITLIKKKLDMLAQLEHDRNEEELNRIRTYAPNGIPSPMMRTLWNLLINRCTATSHRPYFNLHNWLSGSEYDGHISTLRTRLRTWLTPMVFLRPPFRHAKQHESSVCPQHMGDIVDWNIVLFTDNVHYGLRYLSNNSIWRAALPDLLSDFAGPIACRM